MLDHHFRIKLEMIKASIDTLIPVCEKLFNSIRNQGTMPQTWCGGLIIHGADEAIRQKIPVYLCLQLPGKIVLFYLEPTTPGTCHVFIYTSKISNWFFTK